MVYEVFQTAVSEELKNRLGDDYEIAIHKIPKNNGTLLDGLTIFHLNEIATPTFYLQSYYEAYEQGRDLESIIQEILVIYEDHKDQAPFDLKRFSDFSQMRERVAMKLIHTKSNETLLKEIPSIPFHDLSIVFYLFLDKDEHGQMTVLIRNDHLPIWNTDTSELYKLAIDNTPRLYPPCIRSMASLINDMLFVNGTLIQPSFAAASPNTLDLTDSPIPLSILTNTSGIFGASAMLYPGVLKEFSKKIGHDLIILPSSVHEVLLLPYYSTYSFQEMADMVTDVNEKCVPVEEQLSNQVYYYSSAQDSIFLGGDPASRILS